MTAYHPLTFSGMSGSYSVCCIVVEKQWAGVGFLYSSILGHDMVCMMWYYLEVF